MPPRRYDSWESYFYPETIRRDPRSGQVDGTLRNLLDERDADVLHAKEYTRTRERERQLRDGLVSIPRTFDGEHVRAIHRHLFQDVYEWAGEYRTVNMSKGSAPGGFADVGSGGIDRYMADVHRMATSTDWGRLDRAGFVDASSRVFSWLNQAHGFREGNGRAAKVFMEHLAERSAFRFEWGRVSPQEWNQASMYSGPDLGAYEPHPEELRDVFAAIAVERATPAQRDDEAWRGVDLARTQYPTPGHGLGSTGPGGTSASSGSAGPRAGYRSMEGPER